VTVCVACGHNAETPFRFCPECGTPAVEQPPREERRKVVTVLFCDVVGSTGLGSRLDPEPLRALLARYFAEMKAIVESHGGTVEKFIGDAVMAVFGVPTLHEDDALRAVRAAVEMRDALPALGLEGRIGVTTGEVVTGTEERLATGDAVNLAARLEQAAGPGEILIGEGTLRLVRDAAEVEPLAPLELKGKPEPVPAFRLRAASAGPVPRRSTAMVGRERPLRLLREAFAGLESDRCELFTILGAAGIGKSRLVGEFVAGLDARVVSGRCLPYGEGITYWPVVEVLKQLGSRPNDTVASARIAALLGEREEPAAAEDIAWAVRRTLEDAAAAGPVVVVLDDIHWGEPAFLDLIEHIADLSRGAPILLLCMARPELLDRRPGWAGGKLNASTVLLEPLSIDESELLLGEFEDVDAALRVRIRDAAAGIPLFLEEMLAVVTASTPGEVVVPPTIQALLAARLDQLAPADRTVLECGAVEGEVFHRRAVLALGPDILDVDRSLAALIRSELIRPDRGVLAGDEAYRFHHLLLRDAAYEALPKARRADLHQGFALWLESEGGALVELDELVGYHFEQARSYRLELGLEDGGLADAARERLGAAGRRALLRDDPAAATNLLGRAVALLPADEVDLGLELDLVTAHEYAADLEGAVHEAMRLRERSVAACDRVGELCGRIIELLHRGDREPEGSTERIDALVDEAMPVFEDAGDELALWLGYYARGLVARDRMQLAAMQAAHEQGLVLARRLGLVRQEVWNLGYLGAAYVHGPARVEEAAAWLDELESRGITESWVVRDRAYLLAMTGHAEEALAVLTAMLSELAERGTTLSLIRTLEAATEVALLAGDPSRAVLLADEHRRLNEERGNRASLSTVMGRLGRALLLAGRIDEAHAAAARAEELGDRDDIATQVLWRSVRSGVLARRGEHEQAQQLADEAVALVETTDSPDFRGFAHADRGTVLALGGRWEDAAAAFGEALEAFDRKGSVAGVEQVQALVVSLGPWPTSSSPPT
jgi:class 3 adenylate cyclase/tetratricopeptide (TPR) repeat protein